MWDVVSERYGENQLEADNEKWSGSKELENREKPF